jgi:hypothetical protein
MKSRSWVLAINGCPDAYRSGVFGRNYNDENPTQGTECP